eukprot:745533-Hanusia_phi.AAC.1
MNKREEGKGEDWLGGKEMGDGDGFEEGRDIRHKGTGEERMIIASCRAKVSEHECHGQQAAGTRSFPGRRQGGGCTCA